MPTNIVLNNFILYGLNRYRNFIHLPKGEDESSLYLELNDEDDVKEFCTNVLHENPCPDSAVFCVFNDGCMLAVIKIWDDGDQGKYEFMAAKDMHFFSEIDARMRLCCYGLICEITPGLWKIQE